MNLYPTRPQHGGTLDGLRTEAFDYWRVGEVRDEDIPQLDFWIERAGFYKAKPHHGYSMEEYKIHRWTRVFYLVGGSAEFRFQDKITKFSAGDFIIIPPNTPCAYITEEACDYHWFALVGQWPAVWGENPHLITYDIGVDQTLTSHLEGLRELLIVQSAGFQLQALSAFYAILARIENLSTPENVAKSSYPESVRNALIYIEEHCTKPFDVDGASRVAHVSPSYLRALFHKWVGESPKRFHTRCRMERAQHLFETQRLSVQAVAGAVGYDDVGYFSRVFKQFTTYSPSQFMKRSRGEEETEN